MPLTRKQTKFVEEYLVDLNATQAAIRAGYSVATAHSIGHENLSKPEIAEAIGKARAEQSRRTGINADRVLTELAKIAFADIRRVVKWQPNVTAMVEDPDTGEMRMSVTNEVALIAADQIDEETAASIAEISQTAQGALKVKLYDKRAALVDLGRHLGLFTDRTEVTGANGGPVQVERIERVIVDPKD